MINKILGVRIIIFLMVMMEVVLFLVPPTSPHKKIILVETRNVGGFQTSQNVRTTSFMVLLRSMYYPVVNSDSSSLDVP